MKYRRIILITIILLIVAVNCLTVFRLFRYGGKAPQATKAVQEVSVTSIFGSPDTITVYRNGEAFEVSNTDERYNNILTLLEKSHKYVEAFNVIDSFSGGNEFLLELNYDDPHCFSHGDLEYYTTAIKINLYNAGGDMLIQTQKGDVCIGYLSITAQLTNAVN